MIGKGAVRGSRVSFHTLTLVKLSGVFCLQKMQNRYNSYWKLVERRVGGHRFDRQRCSEKCKGLIPCFNLIVPAKYAKPLKLLFEGDR